MRQILLMTIDLATQNRGDSTWVNFTVISYQISELLPCRLHRDFLTLDIQGFITNKITTFNVDC